MVFSRLLYVVHAVARRWAARGLATFQTENCAAALWRLLRPTRLIRVPVTSNILKFRQHRVLGTSFSGRLYSKHFRVALLLPQLVNWQSFNHIISSRESHIMMVDGRKGSNARSCRLHSSEWRCFPNAVARTGTPRACRHRSAAGYDVRLLRLNAQHASCSHVNVGSCDIPTLFSEHSSWPKCFRR